MADGNGREPAGPLPLDQLAALRTDYRDVPVEELGGTELRLYALSGTARAVLVPEMAALAGKDGADENDPEIIRAVFHFRTNVVGASLGYERQLWAQLGDVLGAKVIERLYEIVVELSAMDEASQSEARARLRPMRRVASGTG